MLKKQVLIAGTNDLATAAAIRLFRSGFSVTLLSTEQPFDMHHSRNYSGAVYAGEKEIENITAITIARALEKGDCQPDTSVSDFIRFSQANRKIPIMFGDGLKRCSDILFDYLFACEQDVYELVDDRLKDQAVIISLAGSDYLEQAHYQICNDLVYTGRVIYPFNKDEMVECMPSVPQVSGTNAVKAPLEGVFSTIHNVDGLIHEKQELAAINNIPILSPFSGKISGLLNSGIIIQAGTLFAEIASASDPRPAKALPATSISVAGGVLEAILFDINLEKS